MIIIINQRENKRWNVGRCVFPHLLRHGHEGPRHRRRRLLRPRRRRLLVQPRGRLRQLPPRLCAEEAGGIFFSPSLSFFNFFCGRSYGVSFLEAELWVCGLELGY